MDDHRRQAAAEQKLPEGDPLADGCPPRTAFELSAARSACLRRSGEDEARYAKLLHEDTEQTQQLIEEIGYRGRKIGGAMVSDKHANFIVNVDSAKAKDVDQLIQEIQEKISEQYGIDLITEVERFNWNS